MPRELQIRKRLDGLGTGPAFLLTPPESMRAISRKPRPTTGNSLLARFRRQSVARTALFYPALAWMLTALLDSAFSAKDSSAINTEYVTWLLLLGYPIALLFATRKRLVKRHFFKRLCRGIVHFAIPPRIRIKKVHWDWQRKDISNWPRVSTGQLDGINRYEYSLFSQHGEDGIIRYIFDQIGFGQRYFLEFGFSPRQCNSLRLMLEEHFQGLLIDRSQESCDFFSESARHFNILNVRAVCQFLKCENLDETIRLGAFPRVFDFLSIDVDGNDYWFWKEIESVWARLVVIEYNAGLGPTWSATIPYDPEFRCAGIYPGEFFFGASLAALEKLGRRKGYRLMGCDSRGINAFFLRDDVLAPEIQTLTSEAAYKPHHNWLERGIGVAEQLEIMKSLPYLEV